MQRWEAKLIALFGMFAVIFIFMLLPIKVHSWVSRQGHRAAIILCTLRCFAGGVFLGIIMLHMIPEVRDMLKESWLEPSGIDYPIPELIAVVGFFLILLFERAVLACHKRYQEKGEEGGEIALRTQVMLTGHQAVSGGAEEGGYHHHDHHNHHGPCHHHNHFHGNHHAASNQGFSGDVADDTKKAVTGHGDGSMNGVMTVKPTTADVEKVVVAEGEESEEGMSKTRSLVLLLALSLECIFDGLSVGLQYSTSGVWNMFIAIVSHEFVIAFCLGLELIKYHSSKRVALAAFMYAMIPPIGCAVGMIITETQNSADENTMTIVNGVLIALAAGVFMYCTFIGMLGEELNDDATIGKIAAVFIGCALMAGLAAVPEGSDDSDDIVSTALPEVTTILY